MGCRDAGSINALRQMHNDPMNITAPTDGLRYVRNPSYSLHISHLHGPNLVEEIGDAIPQIVGTTRQFL